MVTDVRCFKQSVIKNADRFFRISYNFYQMLKNNGMLNRTRNDILSIWNTYLFIRYFTVKFCLDIAHVLLIIWSYLYTVKSYRILVYALNLNAHTSIVTMFKSQCTYLNVHILLYISSMYHKPYCLLVYNARWYIKRIENYVIYHTTIVPLMFCVVSLSLHLIIIPLWNVNEYVSPNLSKLNHRLGKIYLVGI